jgi:hypothetical protein
MKDNMVHMGTTEMAWRVYHTLFCGSIYCDCVVCRALDFSDLVKRYVFLKVPLIVSASETVEDCNYPALLMYDSVQMFSEYMSGV